jgi:hypothetical protein
LFDDWALETQTGCYVLGMLDLESSPFAGSPVMSMAMFDESVKCTDSLFHRCAPEIGTMSVNDIDGVKFKSLERSLHAFDDVLSR